MTLQERLMSEVEENIEAVIAEALGYKMDDGEWKAYDFYGNLERITDDIRLETIMEAIHKQILHTIEQTIKEGCEVVEEMKDESLARAEGLMDDQTWTMKIKAMFKDEALTDTQHALRGIIKN